MVMGQQTLGSGFLLFLGWDDYGCFKGSGPGDF
jgi:hypothetical protein